MDSKNQVLPFHLGKLELLVITGEDKVQWYMCLVAGKELSLVGQGSLNSWTLYRPCKWIFILEPWQEASIERGQKSQNASAVTFPKNPC